MLKRVQNKVLFRVFFLLGLAAILIAYLGFIACVCYGLRLTVSKIAHSVLVRIGGFRGRLGKQPVQLKQLRCTGLMGSIN